MIKKYDDGYFTSDLISTSFSGTVKVSCAKGDGLGLQEKTPGKVIIFAGGTGIYPFIDIIDVLFKKMLCDQNHSLKAKILEMDPAVADPCLNSFSFVIMASFNSHLDMHPITLYQLSKLGEMMPPEKFSCLLKIKDYSK